jgi:hypothetical protein
MVMPAMHEKVHQRASQQKKQRQHPEYVRPVLGNKEKCGDDEERREHPSCAAT